MVNSCGRQQRQLQRLDSAVRCRQVASQQWAECAMNERDAAPRAETVGSLLRPRQVTEALPRDGSLPAGDAVEIFDDAVCEAIRVQQDAGLDVITDGEMRRALWAQTPRYLTVSSHGRADPRSTGAAAPRRAGPDPGRYFPAVVRPVRDATRTGDMASEYAFLAERARTRTKYSMAAPSYHRRYWSGEYSGGAYRNCEDFLAEIRDYEREVIADLIALGCDYYIQLDAPSYGSLCDPGTRAQMARDGRDAAAELASDAELDSSLFDGITGVTRALHICRGNGPGGMWHSAGGYGAISAELFPRLRFDRLLLKYDSDRAGGFEPLADVRAGTVVVEGNSQVMIMTLVR
jgi:5-methyltetrahydropteroyltriglutamate--homocysteine methyltransferase